MTDETKLIADGPKSLEIVGGPISLDVVGGPASLEVAQLQLAGGGDFSKMPQQTTMPEIHIEVVTPPPDNTLLIATGIVVPVILAIFGWWVMHRRRAPVVTGASMTPDPFAKTNAEK